MSETANATDDENSQPGQDSKDRLEEFQSAIDRIQCEDGEDSSCGC